MLSFARARESLRLDLSLSSGRVSSQGSCVSASGDSRLRRARLCSMSRAASCCSNTNFVRTVAGEFPGAFSTRANNRRKPCAANCAKKSLWKLMTFSFFSRAPCQGRVRLRFTSRAPRRANPTPSSFEIRKAAWFAPDDLPDDLSRDQRRMIKRAIDVREKRRE